MTSTATVRIGTRGSALALAQANIVRDALAAAGAATEISIITTPGDRRAPDTAWGEGAFVTAIEAALVRGEIDVAVHSAKDVPTDEDPRLAIAAFLERAPSGDVVVLPDGHVATSLDDLPRASRVGTDSPRRTAFLRAVRPDLRLHPLHGNVDTRLRRLDEGQSDALVLAEAGLTRLGRAGRISFRLPAGVVPPAPGQGAIAVQVRASDVATAALVARLDHRPTRVAVEAERALLAASGGGCRAPLGALGRVDATGDLELLGGFARPDGSLATIVRRTAPEAESPRLVDSLLAALAQDASATALAAGDPPVLVTRAANQSAALALALVDRGLAPLLVPSIEIAPAADGLAPALAGIASFDWVVVTSVNAARAVHETASHLGVPLGLDGGPRWAAVGLATARALRASGVSVALRPRRASGASLADELPLQGGERVLVPRSEIADDALVDRLSARGARVEAVMAYRTIEGPAASGSLLEPALAADPRVVIFTSGSTTRGLLALAARAGQAAVERVLATPAICIGPSTSGEARRLGFSVVAEPGSPGVAAIADATAGYLGLHQEST
ncbi:MAG TPA: hydroxymethylbilane synthase [Candidatus Limnocylindrales bacterium]|nr:hydroxymethylbilane synthase [Candidatus Limnocylindrales bacterium]